MLHFFRRFLNTWAARAFFIVLIGSFGLWGISGTVRDLASDTALATVGKRRIEPGEFQDAFRQQMAQVTRTLGGSSEPTAEIRRAVAGQTLERLVTQAALAEEAKSLGLVTPDSALTKAVHDIPQFRGRTGAFDRSQFNSVMRQNNLTEARFLELMRADLTQQQLMQPVQNGVAAPDTPARALYAYQHETRTADYVEFAFAAAPAPPAATPDDLQRFYENNAARYSAPEFRRIKIVVLSPEGLLRDVIVPEEDIAAYFQSHQSEFVRPENRSVQVVIAPDRDVATAIATPWVAGADWTAIQALAASKNSSAAALDDALPTDFPAPELATAVFGATVDQVVGPVQSSLGWQVFRVTKISSLNLSLAEAEPAIRARITRERATDLVYARTTKLEDAIAADPTLDSIPADLGAEAATGELDRNGNTRSGEPAPLPGPEALRPTLLGAAFNQVKGDLPRLVEGADGSYWALIVEDTEAPKLKPYDQIAAEVTEDWAADQRRHSQDVAAGKLLAAIKVGAKLDDAAIMQGVRVQRTVPVPRPDGKTPSPVTEKLAEAIFALPPGEPTMVETPDAFLVATVADIAAPDFGTDPVAARALRATLNQSLSEDVAATFASAVRSRARPTINRAMLDSFIQ